MVVLSAEFGDNQSHEIWAHPGVCDQQYVGLSSRCGTCVIEQVTLSFRMGHYFVLGSIVHIKEPRTLILEE